MRGSGASSSFAGWVFSEQNGTSDITVSISTDNQVTFTQVVIDTITDITPTGTQGFTKIVFANDSANELSSSVDHYYGAYWDI